MRIERHEQLASTQPVAVALVRNAPAGQAVLVHARRQCAGKGREGRHWEAPPGSGVGLFVSIGVRGPLPLDRLQDLPRRLGTLLLGALALDEVACWKAPNDLVAASGGAKVAGMLVDTLVVGDAVEHVVVGIGANLTGPAFTTRDGRAAATVESLGVILRAELDDLSELIAERVVAAVRCRG